MQSSRFPCRSFASEFHNELTNELTLLRKGHGEFVRKVPFSVSTQSADGSYHDLQRQLLTFQANLDVKDAEISALKASLVLASQVQQPRVPISELGKAYLWNKALFPGPSNRTPMHDSPLPTDELGLLFDTLMARRGRYSRTFAENPIVGFKLDRVELFRDSNQQMPFSVLEAKANQLRSNTTKKIGEKIATSCRLI